MEIPVGRNGCKTVKLFQIVHTLSCKVTKMKKYPGTGNIFSEKTVFIDKKGEGETQKRKIMKILRFSNIDEL